MLRVDLHLTEIMSNKVKKATSGCLVAKKAALFFYLVIKSCSFNNINSLF